KLNGNMPGLQVFRFDVFAVVHINFQNDLVSTGKGNFFNNMPHFAIPKQYNFQSYRRLSLRPQVTTGWFPIIDIFKGCTRIVRSLLISNVLSCAKTYESRIFATYQTEVTMISKSRLRR